jgi:formate-dependent nitrite reductase membrane component NrfD
LLYLQWLFLVRGLVYCNSNYITSSVGFEPSIVCTILLYSPLQNPWNFWIYWIILNPECNKQSASFCLLYP